jgi:2-amino-4-hydroxy-6-hydroxymethyldihydropteridine diphosphokinase
MIILGLGSNLGNRKANLNLAINAIASDLLIISKQSSVIENPPLLPPTPEAGWEKKDFLNMAIGGTLKNPLQPEDFLKEIKAIETALGRTPAPVWAPRVIDIDILAWDNLLYNSPTLTIPHKELLKRDFALRPLLEIAPDWKHP